MGKASNVVHGKLAIVSLKSQIRPAMDVSDQSFPASQPASRNPTGAQPHEACPAEVGCGSTQPDCVFGRSFIHLFRRPGPLHHDYIDFDTACPRLPSRESWKKKKGSPPAGGADLTLPGPPRQRGSLSGAFSSPLSMDDHVVPGQCHGPALGIVR
jgi:hypothetical protein